MCVYVPREKWIEKERTARKLRAEFVYYDSVAENRVWGITTFISIQ